jgi:hypothetical protein
VVSLIGSWYPGADTHFSLAMRSLLMRSRASRSLPTM